MKNKYIVEFTVKKESEEKVTTKQTIDGKEVEVTETKKTISDGDVAISTPGRKTIKASSIFYSKRIGYYTQQGLMSTHMVAKRYDNDGGFLSDTEKETVMNLENDKIDVAVEYKKKLEGKTPANKTKKDKEVEEALLKRVMEIQSKLDEINSPYLNIFNHTAEFKAREDTLMWWLFVLTNLKNDKGEYEPLFSTEELNQKEYEGNEVTLGEIEDSDDSFKKEAIRKATYFISFWLNDGDLANESVKERALEDYEEHFGFEHSEKFKGEEKTKDKTKDKTKAKDNDKTNDKTNDKVKVNDKTKAKKKTAPKSEEK